MLKHSSKESYYGMELGAGGPHERDWRGISTALLVIMAICTLIALAVLILTPVSQNADASRSPMNLSDLVTLRSSLVSLQWADDNSIMYETLLNGVELLNINTMRSDKLLDRGTMFFLSLLLQSSPTSFAVSHDLRYFALFSKAPNPSLNVQNSSDFISILNTKNQLTYKVGISRTDDESQNAFEWNPVGNDYVFAQNGHLYYAPSPESKDSIRISRTSNGQWIHGIFDWVYEEEIYGRNRKGLWWSKGGNFLAFVSREIESAKTITMMSYDREHNYPMVSEIQYPKTGEKRLPTYVISIWDKTNRTLKQMDIQLRDSVAFHYLYGVSWVILKGKETFVTVWANRYQNHISITLCEHEIAMCNLVFEHKYPAKTWALPDDFQNILFSDDSIYILLPKKQSDGNSYQHIAKLSIQSDTSNPSVRWAQLFFLSIGTFDVAHMHKFDKMTNTLYFSAHAPYPGNLHLYATKGSVPTNDTWRCISCTFSNCTYQETKISPDSKHLIVRCKGPSHPHVYIGKLDNLTTEMAHELTNLVEILRDEEYEKRIASSQFPVIFDDTIILTSGFEARIKLLLPPDQITKAQSRSLPLLIKVYGGPGSQIVNDEYSIGFEEFLVTTRHYAVLKIDGRGSTSRGWKYRSAIYGALGTVEILDQIETTKLILQKYPFLDASRTAVFGWSYGGFAAANMVAKAPKKFWKCAVSVAPVVNFLYYDATYTERYMGNAAKSAYELGDVTRDVSNFRYTKLLLMHGLYDDNVHFQNSALFIEELQKNSIDFDMMIYPNQGHSMGVRRAHLFNKIDQFLHSCFL